MSHLALYRFDTTLFNWILIYILAGTNDNISEGNMQDREEEMGEEQ